MNRHKILFLAANPIDTDQRALDQEVNAIEAELEQTGHRECFELVTRWAARPLDLLRALRKLRPTVVHFSGHSSASAASGQPCGLLFDGLDGRAQLVSTAALEQTFGAAGASVKLVVLDACYSDAQAEALVAHVDCVVGMGGPIGDQAAKSFAIGFYGGLGDRESVARAYHQGLAAIGLAGLRDDHVPQLKVRPGIDANHLVLAKETSPAPAELIDFTVERQRYVPFFGRADVLKHLDEWLDSPDEAGWVLITGGPGMGKSAILAEWLARREATGALVPHHFIRSQGAGWNRPEVIAASIAAQIEMAYPTLRDPGAKPERRLFDLLGRVAKQRGAAQPLVVVVDGLDETRAGSSDNPLPRFLPHVLPRGIRYLCATRPMYRHLSWIKRNPFRSLDLDDPQWALSNEAVVRSFWEAVASRYQPPLSSDTLREAIARAEGNVLHAVMLHDALRALPANRRRAERIPVGLEALIGEIWDRAASHPAVRVGLGLLCAAQEALSLDVLTELAGWGFDDRERFVRDARQLLLEEPEEWEGNDAYRPRHDWVRELIAKRLGIDTIRCHHATLSRRLATWPARPGEAARRYTLRHALIHRVAAGDWPGVWKLAANTSFLEGRCREMGAHATAVGVAQVAKRCRESGDDALRRRIDDLAQALARESHWLRAAPEATAALVWNRLRRSGWSADDLDEQLCVPTEATFLRIRHWATQDSPALAHDTDGHSGWVRGCAVTADGKRVVSASYDQTLKVWDIDTCRVLATLRGHTSPVRACAVTADNRVVSASLDGTLKIWDLDSGRVLATMDGHADWVDACAVTPDGRRVISASVDTTLKIWNAESGCALATLNGHTDWVCSCAVTSDGRRVVSGSYDRTLRVWDLATGDVLVTLTGHKGDVNGCAVTPDGKRAVSASGDPSLKVWDLATGNVLATLDGHDGEVNACVVTGDGKRVVSASDDRTLKVWDLDSGRALATLDGHARAVFACAVTPDGRRAVSGSDDGTLKVWDLDSGRALLSFPGHGVRTNACAATPDGRVVSASDDGTLKIWDPESGRALATLEGHPEGVNACAVTPDGRCVISASNDRTLRIWDLTSGHALATLAGHTSMVLACAVIPDSRCVVSASRDGTLKVWDLESASVLATLAGHTGGVNACAVTADGRRMVSGSDDRTLKLWDLETRSVIATLAGHTRWVLACAVTPDGRRAVSASYDMTLRVWDLDRGCPLATLEGHRARVLACAVTPDGRRAVSASYDRTLKVWDLDSFRCIFTHRGDVPYATVAVTTTAIVASDVDGVIWFLEWPHGSTAPERGDKHRARSARASAPSPTTRALPPDRPDPALAPDQPSPGTSR